MGDKKVDSGSTKMKELEKKMSDAKIALMNMLVDTRSTNKNLSEKTKILETRAVKLEESNKKLEKIRIALLNMLKDLNQVKKELESEKSQLELRVVERTRRLEEEKRVLETIIENIAYGILVVDPANRILLANSVIEKLLGVEKSDLLGSLVPQIIEDPAILSLLQRGLELKGEYYTKELSIVDKKTGEEKILKGSISPLITRGKGSFGIVIILQDITKEKEIERMKSDFVSNVSHELRTPLASIKGFTETMLTDKEMDEATRTEFLRIIDEETNRLTRLIEDILDLSKIESGRIRMRKEKIQLIGVLKEAVNNLGPQAEKRGVILEARLPESFPTIFADRDKVLQVMSNIITNAIKFTLKGGKVTIGVDEEKDSVKVAVADTGVGILKKDIPYVFEKFYRVERPGTEKRGVGLGLSVAREIVKAHGGGIWLESEEGMGTTVWIRLPKGDFEATEESVGA